MRKLSHYNSLQCNQIADLIGQSNLIKMTKDWGTKLKVGNEVQINIEFANPEDLFHVEIRSMDWNTNYAVWMEESVGQLNDCIDFFTNYVEFIN
jgi:hypothetical protein